MIRAFSRCLLVLSAAIVSMALRERARTRRLFRAARTLVTARGPAFIPSGIAYVDAQLVTLAQPAGARQTSYIGLPPEDLAMATDTSTVWALIFALQFLIVVEIGAVWAYRRVGAQKTWVVFVPLTVLAVLFTANQVTILLPNLL